MEWWSLPSDRHGRSGNLSFADGHVISKKWKISKVYVSFPQPLVEGEFPDWQYVTNCIRQTTD
jgi:prepilin-type processing-associated H-X9-DG protein